MPCFSKTTLQALEATATTSAAYLDACDFGAQHLQLDAEYYRACGLLLVKIFSLMDAERAFPYLIEHSAAAREVVESIRMARRIKVSRLGFYPELAVLLDKVAA
jgi:hypothetical protein